MQETLEVYKNIRALNKKIRVVVLDSCFAFKDIEDSYLNIVELNRIITNRLYDYLPDVPVTAKTIGLNEGEIMEVSVPFASSYAFRHISSIPQIKWKITAIYRDDKLLLPTNATMIRPRDRLLIIGRPNVLTSVYSRIKSKSSKFPEPFGKNFYLYLDIDKDGDRAIEYLQEAIFILDKFDDKELIVRISNPNNYDIVNKLKEYESSKIRLFFSFLDVTEGDVAVDIDSYEIGLILISEESLKANSFSKELYAYRKLIYIFGDTKLSNIKEATIIKSDNEDLEEISSVAFYIAETLKVGLSLREYNPNGNFSDSKYVEHYETLAHVHNIELNIIQEKKNPIKAAKRLKSSLIVIPFRKDMSFNGVMSFLKRDVDSLLIRTNNHPKLLISVAE